MVYEHHQTDDQVAAGRGPRGAAPGPGGPARLLVQVLPKGLHPAPALRPVGAEDLPQDRLPRRRPDARGLRRAARGPRPGRAAPLLDPLLRRQAATKKGEFVVLLFRATARPGTRPDRRQADGRRRCHRHGEPAHLPLLLQAGRPQAQLPAVDQVDRRLRHDEPLLHRGPVSLGPANDAPQFRPVMAQASLAVGYDRVLPTRPSMARRATATAERIWASARR